MLVRVQGWDDTDILALLSLLRKHLLYYVYASDNGFTEMVRTELPDKPASEIKEMMRSLMLQFALGLSTKNFRTDAIVVNGQEVYVYEHIYGSISQLPENKVGGVWLPDELSRFLQKARQYRGLFPGNQDVYFKRIQVWSKSVAETKNKFYALRDIYLREKKRRLCQRKGVECARLELLRAIFAGVPPAHPEEKSAANNKAPKLWSCEDMETLVDFIVRITCQIQKTGSSDLVNHVAETLHRTDGSCVNKLADMKEKFLKKMKTVRAANLPAIIFDPNSEANKVFNADWSDSNDPYALGYLALKSRNIKLTSARNRKRRRKSALTSRSKLQPAMQTDCGSSDSKANSTDPLAKSVARLETAKPVAGAQRVVATSRVYKLRNKGLAAVTRSATVGKAPVNAVRVNDYTAFVQGVVKQCQWKERVVHNVLQYMQRYIGLYRSNKLVVFFSKVASLTPGVTFQELFANVQFILSQFEQHFGSLDGFEDLVADMDSSKMTEHEASDHSDTLDCAASTPSVLQTNAIKGRATESKVAVDDGGKREFGQPPRTSLAQQIFQSRRGDAVIEEGERALAYKQSPVLDSPNRTPQTGNEDAVDEHSSSTVGKHSSPENMWEERVDADLDDDGLDSQSISSSDNAWSCSSSTKDSHYNAKDDSPLNTLYSPSRQLASESSRKVFKRGKDEQYRKSFSKKRRLNEKNAATARDDEESDEDDRDYESYDEVEDDAYQDEDAPLAEVDSLSSDEELEDTPHPLQSILNSLEAHTAELQEKQRVLIEHKKDREWRQRNDMYDIHEYGLQMRMPSFTNS